MQSENSMVDKGSSCQLLYLSSYRIFKSYAEKSVQFFPWKSPKNKQQIINVGKMKCWIMPPTL